MHFSASLGIVGPNELLKNTILMLFLARAGILGPNELLKGATFNALFC